MATDIIARGMASLAGSKVFPFFSTAGGDPVKDVQRVISVPVLSKINSPSSFLASGESLGVAKASEAQLLAFYAFNGNASGKFLWIFDSISASAGAKVKHIVYVPANSGFTLGKDFFGENGMNMNYGIAFGWSANKSAPFTTTSVTASDHIFSCTYI